MEEIYFSVLISVYNDEKYIKECLESVKKQTFKNFEAIIINDGSTDKTGEICDNFAKKDDRFKLYNQKNKGLVASRCQGIKKSKGLFTLFLDSDDYLDFNLLETLKEIIEAYKADMVIYNYKSVDENGSFLFNGVDNFKDREIFEESKEMLYNKIFFTNEINSLWRKAVKTSLINLEDYKNYLDIENGEDNMLSLPLLIKAKKIVNINDKLYNYRYNKNGMTSNFKERKIKDELIRYKYSLKYLNDLKINSDENLKKLNYFFLRKILKLILKFQYLSNKTYKTKKEKLVNLRNLEEIKEMFNKTNIKDFKNSSKKLYKYYYQENYKKLYVFSEFYFLNKKLKKCLNIKNLVKGKK